MKIIRTDKMIAVDTHIASTIKFYAYILVSINYYLTLKGNAAAINA